ncbi:putative stress-associated endoplasmic reticulum protein [Salvia divinorum]|uniref:Stress-associated endoplasmic reticulum protein n=1 Tax=Salvia divinorum TaxID=28513 RepID=A0ABD1IA05_SALDI
MVVFLDPSFLSGVDVVRHSAGTAWPPRFVTQQVYRFWSFLHLEFPLAGLELTSEDTCLAEEDDYAVTLILDSAEEFTPHQKVIVGGSKSSRPSSARNNKMTYLDLRIWVSQRARFGPLTVERDKSHNRRDRSHNLPSFLRQFLRWIHFQTPDLAVKMTTSRRLADRKVEKFEKNINKRGAVTDSSAKKGNNLAVGPVLIGFFIFVVIGSSLFQIIRTATSGGMA